MAFSDIKTSNTTELYDGESWKTGPELPEGRFAHAVVAYTATEIVLFSGYTDGPQARGALDTTYTYDFSAPNIGWVQKSDMPQATYGVSAGHLR